MESTLTDILKVLERIEALLAKQNEQMEGAPSAEDLMEQARQNNIAIYRQAQAEFEERQRLAHLETKGPVN